MWIGISTVIAIFIIGSSIAIWNKRENKGKFAVNGEKYEAVITHSVGMEIHELYETGILEKVTNPLKEDGVREKILDALSRGERVPGGCDSLSTCAAFCESQANIDECLHFVRNLSKESESASFGFIPLRRVSIYLKGMLAIALWPILGPIELLQ